MKKIIIFLLCTTVCIIFSACSKETAGKQQTIETESTSQIAADSEESMNTTNSYGCVYYPFYFENDGIIIVEWKEKCEWLDGYQPPEGKVLYSVNYVHVFPSTFEYYEWDYDESITPEINTIDDLKENRNRIWNYEDCFDYIKNGKEIMECYDDILMVSEYQAENICPGDNYLVTYNYNSLVNNIQCRDVSRGYMFPIKNGYLSFSDMFDELYVTKSEDGLYVTNSQGFNNQLYAITQGNEIIRKEDSEMPIFEDGTSILDLEEYFRQATKKLEKAYWVEANDHSYVSQ